MVGHHQQVITGQNQGKLCRDIFRSPHAVNHVDWESTERNLWLFIASSEVRTMDVERDCVRTKIRGHAGNVWRIGWC